LIGPISWGIWSSRANFTELAVITKMYESRLMLGSYFCTSPKARDPPASHNGIAGEFGKRLNTAVRTNLLN
jgi:hypothetical protein